MTPYLTEFAALALLTLAAFNKNNYKKMKGVTEKRSNSSYESILKKYLRGTVAKPGIVLVDKSFYFFTELQ
jgi:hypothetical protein